MHARRRPLARTVLWIMHVRTDSVVLADTIKGRQQAYSISLAPRVLSGCLSAATHTFILRRDLLPGSNFKFQQLGKFPEIDRSTQDLGSLQIHNQM